MIIALSFSMIFNLGDQQHRYTGHLLVANCCLGCWRGKSYLQCLELSHRQTKYAQLLPSPTISAIALFATKPNHISNCHLNFVQKCNIQVVVLGSISILFQQGKGAKKKGTKFVCTISQRERSGRNTLPRAITAVESCVQTSSVSDLL